MRNAKDLTPLRAARQRLIARCGAALRVHLRRENGTGGLRLVKGTEGKIGAASRAGGFGGLRPRVCPKRAGRPSVAKGGRTNNEAGGVLFGGRGFFSWFPARPKPPSP